MIINLLFHQPLLFFVWIWVILIALSVHEFAHAWAAYLQGDDTAKRFGRLTLNPFAHIDILGFLMLLFVGIGWGKPVPYNPFNLKNKKFGPVIIALAGPLANLFTAIFSGLFLKVLIPLFSPYNLLIQFLRLLLMVNVALMVFNLIPIPPLDGSKVLLEIIPNRMAELKYNLIRRGPFILLLLIILDSFAGNYSLLSRLFSFAVYLIDKFLGI